MDTEWAVTLDFGDAAESDTIVSVLGAWFADFHTRDGKVRWGRLVEVDTEDWYVEVYDPDKIGPRLIDALVRTERIPLGWLRKVVIH